MVNDDAGPDLVVATLMAPAAAAAGSAIDVSDTTRNQGAGAASASTTSFYLSTNAVFDGADVLLGARPVPALAPSASSTSITSLALPPTHRRRQLLRPRPGRRRRGRHRDERSQQHAGRLHRPRAGPRGERAHRSDDRRGGLRDQRRRHHPQPGWRHGAAVFDALLPLHERRLRRRGRAPGSPCRRGARRGRHERGFHLAHPPAHHSRGAPLRPGPGRRRHRRARDERSQQPARRLHLHRTRPRGERPHRSRDQRGGLVDQRQRHHAQPGWRCGAALLDPLLPVHQRDLRRRRRPHRSAVGPGLGGQRGEHGFHSAHHPAHDRRRQLLRPGPRRWRRRSCPRRAKPTTSAPARSRSDPTSW